jgi:hypothetical protein
MAVDKEVVCTFLEDGDKVPESEDATSDVPLVLGASVIGMANSRSVICLRVSNTGGGMMIVASLLVNVGAMVQSWLLYLVS